MNAIKLRLILIATALACLATVARATLDLQWTAPSSVGSGSSYSVKIDCYFSPNYSGDSTFDLWLYRGTSLQASDYGWAYSSATLEQWYSDTGPASITYNAQAQSYYGEFNETWHTVNVAASNSAPSPSISVDGYSHGATVTRPFNGSISVTVRYSATDVNGNLSGIRYNIWNSTTGYFDNGGGGFVAQSGSSGTVVRTVNLSTDGQWYFWTDAQDSAGAYASTGHWSSGYRLNVVQAPNTAPYGWLDSASSSVVQNQTLSGNGWAADNESGAPVNRVEIRIDGSTVVNASLGGYRPDVASAYGRSDHTYSGFSFSYNIGSLSVGQHTVSAVAFDSHGGSATLNGSKTFSVSAPVVAPSITSHPQSQTVIAGSSVSFSVSASGTAPLSYQWRKNGSNISGATSSSYSISNAQSTHVGTYTVVVSNSQGSATSNGASLTVNYPPSITTHPQSQTVNAGANVSFSVSASGTAPLSYQWRKNGTNISGATSSSYSISNVQSSHAGTYTVYISNVAGNVTSNGATLTVNTTSAPSFTTQPQSQTVNPGANVTFTASASGSPAPTYQWRKNGTNISGATASSYSISGVQASHAGNYTVVATNTAGSATSATATLTVNSPPAITSQPQSQSVTAGANVTFTVSASGTAPLSYQWRKNGANISGATSSSYAISNVQTSHAGDYSVVVSNVAGSATSTNASLTVNAGTQADTSNQNQLNIHLPTP